MGDTGVKSVDKGKIKLLGYKEYRLPELYTLFIKDTEIIVMTKEDKMLYSGEFDGEEVYYHREEVVVGTKTGYTLVCSDGVCDLSILDWYSYTSTDKERCYFKYSSDDMSLFYYNKITKEKFKYKVPKRLAKIIETTKGVYSLQYNNEKKILCIAADRDMIKFNGFMKYCGENDISCIIIIIIKIDTGEFGVYRGGSAAMFSSYMLVGNLFINYDLERIGGRLGNEELIEEPYSCKRNYLNYIKLNQ